MISYQSELCARALFELNVSSKAVKSAEELLCSSAELREVLSAPLLNKSERHNIIDRLFDKEIAPFLKVITDMGHSVELDGIFAAYEQLRRKSCKILSARICSARELTAAEKERFSVLLQEKFKANEVCLDVYTDKSLLGGYTLQIGDKLYDKSVSGALAALGKKLDADTRLKL